ncbi:MAG TPA: hypothetical protein VIT67_19035, partial [Povalibacter sp.]
MAMHVDEIVNAVCAGSMSLDAACQSLLTASQNDSSGTRFWGQRIETAMKTQRISRSAARAMLDALEGFQTDKTMWIDSGLATAPGDIGQMPAAERFQAAERLLASFVERNTRRPLAGPDTALPATPLTGPVEWFDSKSMGDAPAGDAPAITPGSILRDRYRLDAHLGAGGIGQAFQAVDLANGENPVTVKIVGVNLRSQPDAFVTLQNAVRRTQHLAHNN